jgi:hypothetical protein
LVCQIGPVDPAEAGTETRPTPTDRTLARRTKKG